MVRKCDVSIYPPKLSLALDVAGKTESMDQDPSVAKTVSFMMQFFTLRFETRRKIVL